jgi:hypothetical protein
MIPEPLGLLIAVVIIASLLVWFFRTAPFVQPPFREWGVWGTIAIAAFILITQVVLPFLGVSWG